jgi:hypothetical protein
MLSSMVTPRVLSWLKNGRSARLLHRFEHVINLVNDQGDLMTLAGRKIGPGPFTMIVEGDFQAGFAAEQPVKIDPQTLRLICGSLVIDARQAEVWEPRPDWERLKTIPSADLTSTAPLPGPIEAFLQQLLQGIVRGDDEMCQAAAFGLAGRGDGLTPTGDDVLLGVLYGLWVWRPRQDLMTLLVDTAVPRTTSLSAAFLRAAAAGEATYHWHDLVNGRAQARTQILSIGHNSGAAAWTGFCQTFMSLKENQAVAT